MHRHHLRPGRCGGHRRASGRRPPRAACLSQLHSAGALAGVQPAAASRTTQATAAAPPCPVLHPSGTPTCSQRQVVVQLHSWKGDGPLEQQQRHVVSEVGAEAEADGGKREGQRGCCPSMIPCHPSS